MRKFPIAAAALLLGTSAYAAVTSTEPSGVWVNKDPWTVGGTTALGAAAVQAMQAQPAAVDWWGADKPATFEAAAAEFKADDEVKADIELAASDDFTTADEEWEAAAAAKAAADTDSEAVDSEVEADTVETSTLDEAPVPVEEGVGGPYEAVAEATPRAAAQNYPACRPGPGDDRCIQLYEPGVRAELATWNQPSGGFAGSGEIQVADSTTETERLNQLALADSASALQAAQMAAAEPVATDAVAVGGPYEPVEEAALMNGDGTVDTAMGEIEADEEVEV